MTAAALVGSVACGDDDGGDGDGGLDGGPSDASLGAGDAGPPPPISMTPMAPTGFACGDQFCLVPESPLAAFGIGGVYMPCCTEDANECGLFVMSTDDAGGISECVTRPPSHPVCPDVDLFSVLQPGCCMDDGMCGVNGAQTGMGCIANPLALFAGEAPSCGDQDAGAEFDGG